MRLIICFILVATYVTGLLYYFKPVKSHYDIEHTTVKGCHPLNEYIIIDLNNKLSKIKSLYSEHVTIKIKGFNVSAVLAYEKNKNFRMRATSIFGLETDVGSNDDVFWFWSKRVKPVALYYAPNEKISKTSLKTPFNPIFIRESLGLEEVKCNGFSKVDDYLWATCDYTDTIGRNLIKKILIDTKNLRIIGCYIYSGNKLLVSSEITEFSADTPVLIKVNWYEENESMTISINHGEINSNIDKSYWNMPRFRNTVNMIKEL